MDFYVDPMLRKQLDKIKKIVRRRDRDYVMVIDGEEGTGKSVLAMQICKYLDDTFNTSRITFNADQFIKTVKEAPKFTSVLLDEAFSASSSRASLTETNRAMIGLATEMRQRNLFVVMVLPSFFDLDKYFALWRCRCLIHVYFNKTGERGSYVIFPKSSKKYLYLYGKKHYNYSKPKSPYPVGRFTNAYVVDEGDYRLAKEQAFRTRKRDRHAIEWKAQRDALVIVLSREFNLSTRKISDIVESTGVGHINYKTVMKILAEEGERIRKRRGLPTSDGKMRVK